MKPWKKILIAFSIILLLFIPLAASAEDKKDEVYDKPKTVEQGGVELDSKRYSLTHYEIVANVEDSWNPFSGEQIDKGLLSLANTFFGVTKLLASWIDDGIGMLYSLDILSNVTDKISNVSDNLWEALKENFGAAFLIIAVIQIFAIYIGQKNQSRAGRMTLRLISVIVVATVWFGSSGFFIKAMNNLSDETQVIIMKTGTPLANADVESGKELEGSVALIRNHFFDLAVYRPYLLMTYGTTNEKTILKKENDKKDKHDRIEELLALKNSKEGYEKKKEIVQNEVDKLHNETLTTANIVANIGIAAISNIFTIILGVPPLLVALFNFIIQIAVIALSIGLPISFIISMIPYFSNSAYNVLGKLVGMFGLKALTGLVMLFIFLINSIIEAIIPLTSATAYFVNVLLTAVGTIFVIVKRDKIVTFVTAGHITTVDAGMPKQIYRQYKTKVEKPAVTAAQKTATFTKAVASSASQKVKAMKGNSGNKGTRTRKPQSAVATAATAAATAMTGPTGTAAIGAAVSYLENRRNQRLKQDKTTKSKKSSTKQPSDIKKRTDQRTSQNTTSTSKESTKSTQSTQSTEAAKVNRPKQTKQRPEPHTDTNLNERRSSQRTVYQPPTKKEEE